MTHRSFQLMSQKLLYSWWSVTLSSLSGGPLGEAAKRDRLADWTDNHTTANQLCLQDDIITRVNSNESTGNFFLLFFSLRVDLTAVTSQRPIGFEEGPHRPTAPPSHWPARRGARWRPEAIMGVRKPIGQRSTFAKPQGSETRRGLVYSFCGFTRVLIGRVCVCTANHQAAIFTIFIEIYAVFRFSAVIATWVPDRRPDLVQE